jgi:hypothetical protein
MKRLKTFLSKLKEWQGLIGAILFFISLYFVATNYIDSHINEIVSDREFLSTLAHRVQPSLIIDQNKCIEADFGACEYIDSIDFMVNTNLDTKYNLFLSSMLEVPVGVSGYPMPNQIIVNPKQHLSYAPIITPLPPFTFAYTARRGEGHRWIYELSFMTGYPDANPPPLRVKVDVMK